MSTNYLIYDFLNQVKEKREKRKKQYGIHPFHKQYRDTLGFSNNIRILRDYPLKFFDVFRMSPEQYDSILSSVSNDLMKLARNAFIPKLRLDVTLRYICSGLPVVEVANEFMIGECTASGIIFETCEAIVKNFKKFVNFPSSQSEWYNIAYQFYERNGIPNCIGCIDGKHIWVKKPANSGSAYKNYKNGFSLSLLAICDANYKFIYYDVGGFGSESESDSGIFKNSVLYTRMKCSQLGLPPAEYNNIVRAFIPFAFYGDAAFGLDTHMMRTFEGKLLPEVEKYFNYKHSSTRIAIEQAFGILVSRFRLLNSAMNVYVKKAEVIVAACIILHNFLMTESENVSESEYDYINDQQNMETLPNPKK
uniref:CSON007312 protein n=1 Tax=Culicoides sonorensis TaxID=179676 RepID=A0A336LBA8_CULSO